MGIGTGILLYQIIWIVVFFMVLPWRGKYFSSKKSFKIEILLKIGLSTLLAFIGWGIGFYLINSSFFSFRHEKAPWMISKKVSFIYSSKGDNKDLR